MNQKGFTPIILLFIVASLAVAAGAYFYGKGGLRLPATKQPASPGAQVSATPTPNETASWETYTDVKSNLTFKYPKSWTVTADDFRDEGDVELNRNIHISTNVGKDKYYLSVFIFRGDRNCTLVSDLSEAQLRKLASKYNKVTFLGREGYRASLEEGQFDDSDRKDEYPVQQVVRFKINPSGVEENSNFRFCLTDPNVAKRQIFQIYYGSDTFYPEKITRKEVNLSVLHALDAILSTFKITQ